MNIPSGETSKMPSINILNYQKLEDEVLNRFRWVLNDLDYKERIEEKTSILTYTSGTDYYNLSNTLSYIRRVTLVDENDQETMLLRYGKDYEITFRGPNINKIKITMNLNNNDKFKVQFGEIKSNGSNWVYPDHPDETITKRSFPRVGFELNINTSVGGFGGGLQIAYDNDVMIQFKFVDDNINYINALFEEAVNHVKKYPRTYHNFRYIRPMNYDNTRVYNDDTNNSLNRLCQFIVEGKKEVVAMEELE